MSKNFFVCWIAAFVAWMGGSLIVHGVLLLILEMLAAFLSRNSARG